MLKKFSNFLQNISYSKLFAINEIEESKTLQVLFYAISASFFVTFCNWVENSTVSISSFLKGLYVCPPYFQTCGKYYFLEGLPYGYTQGLFYLILFLTLLYGLISAVKQNWESAHKAILITFAWKIIFIFFLTYGIGGNFDYYDCILAFIWLFLREKEYFAKVTFVTFYFMASTIKIHEGWILGNYFTSTILGAPFFNNNILPFFTNIVITMQMVGSWFLFSKNIKIQRLVFLYFLLFHMYSGIIVNYRYITISIPALIILFGYNFNFFRIKGSQDFSIMKISKKTIFGYVSILLLLLSQSIGILIPGDQKKTLEGNFYGLYMFEANHQCTSKAIIVYENNATQKIERTNVIANNRCDPYHYWFPLKKICERNTKISRIEWTFDHSVNGNNYERIVEVNNLCALEYKNLMHNTWIKINGEAEILSTPVYKNGYSREMYSESYTIPTSPKKSDLYPTYVKFYWALWCITFIYILSLIIKKNKHE